jgi:DNA-binding protein HU-beta
MNRSELIAAAAERSGLSGADVDKALTAVFEEFAAALGRGDKVTVPGWLTLSKGHRAARTGRNPQTGAEIQIAATDTAKLSPGSKLKEAAAG